MCIQRARVVFPLFFPTHNTQQPQYAHGLALPLFSNVLYVKPTVEEMNTRKPIALQRFVFSTFHVRIEKRGKLLPLKRLGSSGPARHCALETSSQSTRSAHLHVNVWYPYSSKQVLILKAPLSCLATVPRVVGIMAAVGVSTKNLQNTDTGKQFQGGASSPWK